jgi:hypothetical protein
VTDLLEPGARLTGEIPKPDPDRRPVPLWLAALSTTGWAVLTSMGPLVAVVLLVWVADSATGSRAVDAFQVGIGVWLLAHGATLQLGGVLVGLAPLLVTAVAFWQLVRAGTNAARAVGAAKLPMAAQVVAAVAGCYTIVGVFASVAVLGSPAQVPVLPAICAVAALGLLGSAVGVLRVESIRRDLLARFPAPALSVVRAAVTASVAILGAGAVIVAVGMILHWHRTVTLMGGLDDGPVGVIGLWVVCVLYVPTVAVWGAAYVLGPGFAVGTATHVGLTGVTLGPLPAVPLFGALPTAAAPWPAYALIALPVAAGVGAALMLRRLLAEQESWVARLGYAVAIGPVAGVLLAAAALASAGPLGSARLSEVGPSGWQVGLAGGLEVAVGAAGLVGFDYAWEWWQGFLAARGADVPDELLTEPVPTEVDQPTERVTAEDSSAAEEPAEETAEAEADEPDPIAENSTSEPAADDEPAPDKSE